MTQNNPPLHSEELEQAIIGHMIYSPELLSDIINRTTVSQFYFDKHQAIYANILELINTNKIVDVLLLTVHMDKNKTLSTAGGAGYLASLYHVLLSGANINEHISELCRFYILRETIKSIQRALIEANKQDTGIEEIIDGLKQSIAAINISTIQPPYKAIAEVRDTVYQEIELYEQNKSIGISTGFIDLDNQMGGMHKNDLIVLAGVTSIGKTTFALNIASNLINRGLGVGYISMETSTSIIYQKLACMDIRKDYASLRRGYFTPKDYSELKAMVEALSELPLYVIDNGSIDRIGVLVGARRMRQERGVELIIIDYLQQISHHNDRDMRVQQVSGDVRAIKGLNVDLGVPIILISSLSRAVDMGIDKKPQLSHLKESGDIEYSIDTALMLYRNKDDANDKNVVILIEKQRHCGKGQVTLQYQYQGNRYVNCEHYQTWHDKE